jgi:hypothetical protein
LSEAEGVGILELARELSLHGFSPKGMARKMRDTLEDPETPANVRHSTMGLAIKVFTQAAEANNKTDFQTMSRQELVEYIERLMKRHDDKLPEVLTGASHEAPATNQV